MLRAQQREPVRGDLDIGLDIEEIRTTKRSIFKRLSIQKCEEAAFAALIENRDIGKKGKCIRYNGSSLEMADYVPTAS